MNDSPQQIIRRHCLPLQPLPTETRERLQPLPGIQAVLFDIYGTLLVSGAGDMTLQTGSSSDDAFRDTLGDNPETRRLAEAVSVELLQQTIAAHHAAARDQGIAYPEVDIVAVWAEVLEKIATIEPRLAAAIANENPAQLALNYECRVNPVWPMPGMLQTLRRLKEQDLPLGIVSNAQQMTPGLFPVLTGFDLQQLGFSTDLCFFSYRYRESKPGLRMFSAAKDALALTGIAPDQTVYIGNDMLKDVWAAAQVGFKTILFAGDTRSLRLRADNEQVNKIQPDAIVTRLDSILECILK